MKKIFLYVDTSVFCPFTFYFGGRKNSRRDDIITVQKLPFLCDHYCEYLTMLGLIYIE